MVELKIDERLAELGKTWYWLALESGIGHSAAYNLRHKKVQAIRFDTLDNICRVLQCEPGDILIRADKRPASETASTTKPGKARQRKSRRS